MSKENNQEWISVDDQWPDFNKRVNIVIADIWVSSGKLTANGWLEYNSVGLIEIKNDHPVTHWQYLPPLPQPPNTLNTKS